MSWFQRRPTQQQEVEAAITVASNLYLHTGPEADDAPAALDFSLPDSRYRYLIFCFSAMTAACGKEMKNADAVVNECLRFLVGWTTSEEEIEKFFVGPVELQAVATNGAAYFQEFLNQWSRCIELEKQGKHSEINDLICTMIHTTESSEPTGANDMQRLSELALQIDCRLPTMGGAFSELVNR